MVFEKLRRFCRYFNPFREPDVYIGGRENPYLLRWYLIPRNHLFNIYLHKIVRDDDPRGGHDHPWLSVSLMLSGSYKELLYKRDKVISSRVFKRGSVIFRSAEYTHRLELFGHKPCWTLFITGPKVREWGFWCPKGWINWKEFISPTDSSVIGKGCD